MAARFGDGIRPELGATDFSGFLQGSAQSSAAIGQGLAKLGAGAGQFLQDAAEKKKQIKGMEVEKKSTLQFLEATMGMIEDPKRKAQLGTVIDQVTMAPLQEAVAIGKNAKAAIGFLGDEMNRQQTKQYQEGTLKLGRDKFEWESGEAYEDTQDEIKRKAELESAKESRDKELHNIARGVAHEAKWRRENPIEYRNGIGYEPVYPGMPDSDGAPDQSAPSDGGKPKVGTKPLEDSNSLLKKASKGKVHYASEVVAQIDKENISAHFARREKLLNYRRDVKELQELKKLVAGLPDFTNEAVKRKMGAAWANWISKGKMGTDIESAGAGADPAYQQMLGTAEKYANLLAASRNKVMTDEDLNSARRQIFNPLLTPSENMRRIDKMSSDILHGGSVVEAGDKWFMENNTLQGFQPQNVDPPAPPMSVDERKEHFANTPASAWEYENGKVGPITPGQLSTPNTEAVRKRRIVTEHMSSLDDKGREEFMKTPPSKWPAKLLKELGEDNGQQGSTGPAGPPGARNNVPNEPVGNDITSFVKEFEGWNPRAYSDYGQRSIGYGTKAKRGEKTITKAEAEKRLAKELAGHRKRVEAANKKYGYQWTPAQMDALTSFDYNTGKLEQLTAHGRRNNATIAKKMLLYKKAKGTTLKGLVRRRQAESKLFQSGYGETAMAPSQLSDEELINALQNLA